MSSEYSNSEPIKLSKSSCTILCHKIIRYIAYIETDDTDIETDDTDIETDDTDIETDDTDIETDDTDIETDDNI